MNCCCTISLICVSKVINEALVEENNSFLSSSSERNCSVASFVSQFTRIILTVLSCYQLRQISGSLLTYLPLQKMNPTVFLLHVQWDSFSLAEYFEICEKNRALEQASNS